VLLLKKLLLSQLKSQKQLLKAKKKNKKMLKSKNISKEKINKLTPEWLAVTKMAAVILLISVLVLFLYFFQPDFLKIKINKLEPTKQTAPEIKDVSTNECLGCKARLFDGIMDAPQSEKSRPYAVMIDNYPAARPQFGLSAASLVYEIPVEGGVTRYLAFFLPETAPLKIGPIRSARDYFLNFAKEFSATYVHCGGSPEALALVKNLGNSDLNEFYKGPYFWREQSRPAPHNVLTSGANLNRYRLDYPEKSDFFDAWKYKQPGTAQSTNTSRIDVKYKNEYAVYWQYDPSTNKYSRFLDQKAHKDESGVEIKANNLIIHLSSFQVIDEKLRLKMADVSSGQALLCQDGNCLIGQYKKDTSGQTKYYLKDSNEFTFNAGITWVEIIEDWDDVQY
jgi:hypothetical protein